MGDVYDGPVVYVDGAHWPVVDGQPDLSSRLLWRDGVYVYASDDDPTHFELYHRDYVRLEAL